MSITVQTDLEKIHKKKLQSLTDDYIQECLYEEITDEVHKLCKQWVKDKKPQLKKQVEAELKKLMPSLIKYQTDEIVARWKNRY